MVSTCIPETLAVSKMNCLQSWKRNSLTTENQQVMFLLKFLTQPYPKMKFFGFGKGGAHDQSHHPVSIMLLCMFLARFKPYSDKGVQGGFGT